MGGFRLYSRVKAGTSRAALTVHRSSFYPSDALSPGVAVTAPGFPLPAIVSRHPGARAPSPQYPSASYPHAAETAAAAWRNPAGRSESGSFFDETEAQRRTLGPRLPYHRRHPMTADEALAGIITVLVCSAALIYLIARWLA